jgi:hypothetical protein
LSVQEARDGRATRPCQETQKGVVDEDHRISRSVYIELDSARERRCEGGEREERAEDIIEECRLIAPQSGRDILHVTSRDASIQSTRAGIL